MKNNKAITLIALIITIVIIIILTGVIINLTLGENGIFNRAKEAKEMTEYSAALEKVQLKIANANMESIKNKGRTATLEELEEYFKNNEELEVVLIKYESIAYLGENVQRPQNVTGIWIKLVEYKKYSFLIGTEGKIEAVSLDDGITKQPIGNLDDNKEEKIGLQFDFSNNKNDFIDTKGETIVDADGIKAKSYEAGADLWNYAISERNIDFTSKFQISANIIFYNGTAYNMGGIQLNFYKDTQKVWCISLQDAWESNNNVTTWFGNDTTTLYSNTAYNVDASGKYEIIGDGNTVYAFFNNELLGKIDCREGIECNKIEIVFMQYPSHSAPEICLKDLYVGSLKDYREGEEELEFNFANNKNNFIDTEGTLLVDEEGIKANEYGTGSGSWKYSTAKKDVNINLNSKFRILADILFENGTISNLGGIQLNFYKDNEEKFLIMLSDSWSANQNVTTLIRKGETNVLYNSTQANSNASGKYEIIGDGKKIYIFNNNQLLQKIDNTDGIECNRIEIVFSKYSSYSTPNVKLNKLQIGTPLHYIGE